MPTILRLPRWCVWSVLVLLAAAAFFYLDADFPNHSRWADDAARFTDEGWWASGAFNHILTGEWLVPGDYNPDVSLPLWTTLLEIVFHFFGIQVTLARGLDFVFTIGTVLVSGALMARARPALAPVLMLLVGTCPLLYFFSRMALLEGPLLFFTMATALAAYTLRPPGVGRLLVCGLMGTLAMFTKTSVIFVAPAILFLLWFPHRHLWTSKLPEERAERMRAIRMVFIPAIPVIVFYGIFWWTILRTHPADVHTFYGYNNPTLNLHSFEKAARIFYRSFTWMDFILFPLAVLAVVLSLRWLKVLWLEPLFGFAVLFFCGYSAFIVYHFDGEPHIFPPLVAPVMIVVVLLLGAVQTAMPRAFTALGAIMLLAVILNVGYIVKLLAQRDYTFRDACLKIRSRILADNPGPNPLVLGHGAMQTTYFTRIPALDDLGEMSVDEKIARYHPGWVVSWNSELGQVQKPDVTERYNLIDEGHYPAFDDPSRSYLILYRIEPR